LKICLIEVLFFGGITLNSLHHMGMKNASCSTWQQLPLAAPIIFQEGVLSFSNQLLKLQDISNTC
jgi:hypothetical protein